MKRNLLLFTLTAAATILVLSSYITGPAQNGQGNRSAAGCGGSTCHGTNASSATIPGIVLIDKVTGLVVSNFKYVPGRGYTLLLQGTNTTGGHTKFGFQITSVQKLSPGTQAGTFSAWPGSGLVHSLPVGGLQIVEHGAVLTATSSGIDSVKMDWTAPATNVGTVRIQYMFNCVNNNGQADVGDQWNGSFTDLDPGPVGVDEVADKGTVSIYPNPASEVLHLMLKVPGSYKASIVDATGKMVYASNVTWSGQNDDLRLPVRELTAGMYMLVLEGSNGRQAVRFVKR